MRLTHVERGNVKKGLYSPIEIFQPRLTSKSELGRRFDRRAQGLHRSVPPIRQPPTIGDRESKKNLRCFGMLGVNVSTMSPWPQSTAVIPFPRLPAVLCRLGHALVLRPSRTLGQKQN
jgi:hypothetical protein